MKPQYERVTFPKGCSLRVYHRRVPAIPFEWHHHPEYELTLTLNSRGWRFIGDHVGQYESPDLVLVPSDMPHTWASTATLVKGEPHTAIVIWFSGAWALRVAEICPEYGKLRKLLRNASNGLVFAGETATRVAGRLDGLLNESATSRLHTALDLLLELADAQATQLSKAAATVATTLDAEPAQLTRVLNHLHKRFHETVRIGALCRIGNISSRSLHRLFVKHTGESVSAYLSKLRIGRACMRLAETNFPVSMIADEVGLSNLANFNRQFRRIRQMTPTAYREHFRKHGTSPDRSPAKDLLIRPPSLEHSRRAPAVSQHTH
ncbi:MAG: helix-turn-helix domain-containing protein [Acidobacteriaceae bacterium]